MKPTRIYRRFQKSIIMLLMTGLIASMAQACGDSTHKKPASPPSVSHSR